MTTFALSKYVNQYPLLTQDEEQNLSKDYKLNNNIEAAHKLAMHHLQLVFKVANRYKGYGLDVNDLAQEAFVGLLEAIKKFDYTKGIRLAAFAVYDMKYRVGEYILKNYRQVKIATTKHAMRLFWNREVVNNDTNVLETLNITKAQLEDFETRYAGKESSVDNETTLLQLPSHFKTPLEHLQDRDEQRQVEALKAAVSALPERERVILESRHLTDNPVPLRELGERFGVSAARIEQVEKQTIKALQARLVHV